VRASDVDGFTRALVHSLTIPIGATGLTMASAFPTLEPEQAKFAKAVAEELSKHHGSSVIIPGDHQPASVHAFAHAVNSALGNVGNTVFFTDPIDANPDNQTESLRDLVADMRAGKVDLLVIMGGNPAYD